jgi:hypothetical protein
MQRRSRKFAGFLQRHGSLVLAAGVMAVLVNLTGIALQVRPSVAGQQLQCSLKSGPNRGKSPSRSIFDSRSAASRIDRIVSGALQVASSL